jgi:hypothetical protein
MIRSLVARFTLMTLAVAACGPSSQPAVGGADEAAVTLAAAKARAQDLANSTRSYQPVRFVSEIEQVRVPRPVKRLEPADVVRQGLETRPVQVVLVPSTATQDVAPAVHVDSTTESVDAPRVPSIIPREAPLPAAVAGGSGNWRGTDPGPDMGTVIGVVLRGGRGDPGHCPRHPARPPSQIPNRIPRR